MSEFDFTSGDYAIHATTVSARHFGTVYSTFYGLDAFEAQTQLIGGSGYRWPGGTRGETALDEFDKDGDLDTSEYLFSLTQENLTTIAGKGLSEVMAAAVASNAEFSIFVPSLRYLDDPETGAADVKAFMEKLLSGHYGALPRSMIIELGNETLDGSVERAEAYGHLADQQLLAIKSVIGSHIGEIPDIKIAVQIGRSAQEDAAIRDAISKDAMGMIDALISHHLPINIDNHNKTLVAESPLDEGDSRFTRSTDYIDAWERAVAEATRKSAIDLEHIVSAWTVGPPSDFSASDLEYQDIGARQGRTTVDTFVQLLAAGADAASLWGIDARANPNYFTKYDEGQIIVSHGGEAFKLMSESLEGMSLMNGHVQQPDAGSWVYAFEDSQKYVLFVVANDIDAPETVTISLDNVDISRAVESVRLSSDLILDAPNNQDDMRAYEVPVIAHDTIMLGADEFDFVVSQDFEVNRLTVWKEEATETAPISNWDSLSAASSLFSAGSGKTVVAEDDAHWGLTGTSSDEMIFDKAGDTLITGNGGADQFVFRPNGGKNIIFDFGQGSEMDELIFYAFGYASDAEAREKMSITDRGVYFEDQGTSILLDGLTVDTLDEFQF